MKWRTLPARPLSGSLTMAQQWGQKCTPRPAAPHQVICFRCLPEMLSLRSCLCSLTERLSGIQDDQIDIDKAIMMSDRESPWLRVKTGEGSL
jgi:hypothetical protein